ncbi:NUDIX hydrolase [Alkalicoccus luteus]|uniref:NUDIX hydrolase n=1 Tax=Alkalicoccus luteus TaxID=1237094 RepID=A0A969TVZ7_9BACI|nr:NUDIX hydrolase [Alkalicoccus luteus]NJP36864.1 NUDIX hydrolase [Alkalicoccus luteus]
MKRVDVAYVLLQKEDRVLLVHNKKHDSWSLPGGGVEAEETLAQAAVREVKEETGLAVTLQGIAGINEAFLKGNHVLFITFHGTIVGGTEQIEDTDTVSAMNWTDAKAAAEMMPYLADVWSLMLEGEAPYRLQ